MEETLKIKCFFRSQGGGSGTPRALPLGAPLGMQTVVH